MELMDREECNLCMYIAKLRDGSKRVQKIQNNLEKELRWKGRENGLTQEDLKLNCFSPL
jgi:hypothetical protein